MSAHTKGPWHRNIKPATKYPTVFSGRNTHVAVVTVVGLLPEEVEANCNLVAAAPDLLNALILVRSIIIDGAMTGFNCHDGDWAKRLFESQSVSAEAVTKAQGT